MASQYTVALTVSSRNRNTTRYPHAHSYEMKLPTAIPRVRQVMLSSIELNTAARNVDSPGELFPFGEGVELSGDQYCEIPGQFNFNNEIILRQPESAQAQAYVLCTQVAASTGAGIVGLAPLLGDTDVSGETDTLRVGDAVQSRRVGYSRPCRGKIACISADKTYHIEFEDGEVQRGVPACHVESLPLRPDQNKNHRPAGAGGYQLIPTWRPVCPEEMNCETKITTTTSIKVDMPAKLNRVVGVLGNQVTTQAPHGLRGALCAGLAVHLVDAGCPVPLTPRSVEIIDEITFKLLNPCVAPAVGMALHAAPMLQADVLRVLTEQLRCTDFRVSISEHTGAYRISAPRRFTLVLGASTAYALGFSGVCDKSALSQDAQRDADGGAEWHVEGCTPYASFYTARVPPSVTGGNYENIGTFGAGVCDAMNHFVISSHQAHFCIRSFNGVPRIVRVAPGQYEPSQLAEAVQLALNAVTSEDTAESFSVTYAETGGRGHFSIGNTQCAFSLELHINPNVSDANSAMPLFPSHFLRRYMGFEGRQYTGAACYRGQPVHLMTASAGAACQSPPVRSLPRYRYRLLPPNDTSLHSRQLRMCAERWYSGEACEKVLAGQMAAGDDVCVVAYDSTSKVLTIKANSTLGVLAGDVLAVGLPGCPECPLVLSVGKNDIEFKAGTGPTHPVQTISLTLNDTIASLKAIEELGTSGRPCPARVWLFDTPRFELPLYPGAGGADAPSATHAPCETSGSARIDSYAAMTRMMGWDRAYYGGCACYVAPHCYTLTPHPFVLVRIGTPSSSAPFKYYAGTGSWSPSPRTWRCPLPTASSMNRMISRHRDLA